MDPDVTLKNAREAAAAILYVRDNPSADQGNDDATMAIHAEDLATHFQALDEWLSRGCFKPTDWAK